MSDSIWQILPPRLYDSCDSSLRSLLESCVFEFSLDSETGRISLVLMTKQEKIAFRLAKRSQSLLNRLRRLVGDNCSVAIVHDIARTGEPTYIIQPESILERDGYYTGPLIQVGESQMKLVESAT